MEKTLENISRILMQQYSNVSSPGLLHGKMGQMIFFFHYERYTGDQSYKDHAISLMSDLKKQINQQPVINYADGLAGIGTGIEYLLQNDFIKGDTNKILKNFDKQIFGATVFGDHTDSSLFTGLSGLGRYLLFRVTGHSDNNEHISVIDNKMLLIHIIDTFERLYFSMKKTEIDDVFKFLHGMDQTKIYPAKTKRLIEVFLSNPSLSNHDNIVFEHIRNIDTLYQKKYDEYLSEIQDNNHPNIVLGLYGGLAGIGLYLLSKLDKRHETWMELL
jgi:lantibiotic modifying enzyme